MQSLYIWTQQKSIFFLSEKFVEKIVFKIPGLMNIGHQFSSLPIWGNVPKSFYTLSDGFTIK